MLLIIRATCAEQHERQRYLSNDQQTSELEAVRARGNRSRRSRLHRLAEVAPRGPPGRTQAKQHGSSCSDEDRKDDREAVEPKHPEADPRQTRGAFGEHHPKVGHQPDARQNDSIRDCESGGGAEKRQQQALGHALADDAKAACAEREPYADFALSRESPDERQICEIDTRDQQYKGDRPEQEQNRSANEWIDSLVIERYRVRAPGPTGGASRSSSWILECCVDLTAKHRHSRLRLIHGDAGLATGHDAVRVVPCLSEITRGERRDRNPDVGLST